MYTMWNGCIEYVRITLTWEFVSRSVPTRGHTPLEVGIAGNPLRLVVVLQCKLKPLALLECGTCSCCIPMLLTVLKMQFVDSAYNCIMITCMTLTAVRIVRIFCFVAMCPYALLFVLWLDLIFGRAIIAGFHKLDVLLFICLFTCANQKDRSAWCLARMHAIVQSLQPPVVRRST